MRDAYVGGVGMTNFGKFPTTTVRALAAAATTQAVGDARLQVSDIQMAFFGNAVGGALTGQEMIRGQVALRDTGILGVPIVNVENACASSSTAFHLAWLAVSSGHVDVALAVGAEKLTHPEKRRTFDAIGTGVDVERVAELECQLYGPDSALPTDRSLFMDIYADIARQYSERTGATAHDYASVAVKSREFAVHNPRAQCRTKVSVEDVLASRTVSAPLTVLMCSPIGDGAAALVVLTRELALRTGQPTIRIRASTMSSGGDELPDESAVKRAAQAAYEQAGVSPLEIDVFEVHDAASPAELLLYEELGLCMPGDAGRLIATGETAIGGRIPVNPSGGLLGRGHPIGATGCAQLVELTEQLRGQSGPRQTHSARIGLAENGGGHLGNAPAAAAITILSRES